MVKKTAQEFLMVVIFLIFSLFVFSKTLHAQVPTPYIKCGQTSNEEWHSLRPYQASPCKIPINMDEQALICGNDLVVNDIIYVPQDDHEILCQPVCGGCVNNCLIRVGGLRYPNRHFQIYFDAYESELPIAGNTELVKGDDPGLLSIVSKDIRLEDLKKSQPPKLEEYDNSFDYYVAYQRWRGNGCVVVNIPVINKDVAVCGQNPFSPDFYSNLYPKIPYSSTEDRIGKARVDDMIWDPDKSSVIRIMPYPDRPETIWRPHDPKYGSDPNIKGDGGDYGETPLYFPHMEESVELTDLLQSTYVPQELLKLEQTMGKVKPVDTSNAECKIVNIRKNPGDQLFGERVNYDSGEGIPLADVYYKAEFTCPVCWTPPPPQGTCAPKFSCEKNAWFHADVSTYTPLIDELFTKTVAGNASVVKKVFPQIGENTPIEEIEDIPASTSVKHAAIDKKISHVELISSPAEFYIPHFGSIYDYLLEDMQTALRPKGYYGKPLGLSKNNTISEGNLVNEYLSWYLNGTLYRAEQGPLDTRVSLLEKIFGKKTDAYRIVSLTGPLNKLLSQNSQWYAMFGKPKENGKDTEIAGKVNQTEIAGKEKQRHNQITGCVAGIKVPLFVGGIVVPCESESQKDLPDGSDPGSTPIPPDSGTCPDVADSEIPEAFVNMKPNFISIADRLLPPYTGDRYNLAKECYNYVVKESLAKGVNAGFSLAIWLHESGASNYAYGGPTTQDMGINDSTIYQNLEAQLARFLLLPTSAEYINCSNDTSQGWPTRMYGFLCRFSNDGTDNETQEHREEWEGCKNISPDCNPNDPGAFYNLMTTYFNWVTACGSLPSYPDDKSCPAY